MGLTAAVQAQPNSPLETRPPQSSAVAPETGGGAPPSIQAALGSFGDPGGIRAALDARGIGYNVVYTDEVLGNIAGGFRRGAIHAGKIEAILTIDLGKLLGARGVSLFANAFQIHDTGGLRDRTFGSLVTISNIEAVRSTRLSELWLEQKWDADRFGLRVGQLVADGEFFASETGKLFLGNDWPTITGANLPSGGPAYPLSSPGVRLRYDRDKHVSVLAAVFDGNPGDQRLSNRTGTNFLLDDPPLVIAEMQYRSRETPEDLAGNMKLGGYHHFGRFADQRFDVAGLPLARPSSSGNARQLRGTSGLYGVADLQVYRQDDGGPDDGIALYTRISASPSDRDLIDSWADGGIVFSGMVPQRPGDQFGASFIYARISESARGSDFDARRFGSGFLPLRSFEATVELNYRAQILPGWQVQPDVQYLFNPGGGIVSPVDPNTRTNGGLVLGIRSTIVY